jgi:hypothetical protein
MAHTAARLMLAGRQMRESKMADGDALSAFGGKSVRNAIKRRRHLLHSRETDLGVAKRLDSNVREDTMLINETAWPAMVAGCMSYGKCRIKLRGETKSGKKRGIVEKTVNHDRVDWVFMTRTRILRYVLGVGLLVLSPVSVFAHQMSLIRAEAVVHRDKLELTVTVIPEDILIAACGAHVLTDWVAKADILQGVEAHSRFLLDGLIILDEDGHRLTGKVTKVELPPLPDDTILLDDLRATTIVYRVEFPLAKPPARLRFLQHFDIASFVLPVVMLLTVTREGLTSAIMMAVPWSENAETVTFDWTETPGTATAVTGGTPTPEPPVFDVTDVFLYIQSEEVRIEILMPLSTLETWLPIPRVNPEILEDLEQTAAYNALERFFTAQNELKIDGILVKPKLDRLAFYGIHYKDFSVKPQGERLSAASTRIEAILTYSTKGTPRHVELKWTLFNTNEPIVRAVVFAYDEGLRLLFQPDQPTFVWDNPGVPPLPKIEAIPTRQNASNDDARAVLSEMLLRNVYRGFDYREETDIYEALAQSVQGELLADLYLKIKRSLILLDQGEAVARVKEVKVTKSEPAAGQVKDGFVERVTWQVEGTVEHWGHIHTRVNEYTADLGIAPDRGVWKIKLMDVVKQSQVSSEVSLRRL